MDEIKEITLSELRERIEILYKRGTAALNPKNWENSVFPDIGVSVQLDEDDTYYDHIDMAISKYLNITAERRRIGESLRIRRLIINYTGDTKKLQITAPRKFIDIFSCEDIEFNCTENVLDPIFPMLNYISLVIITNKCLVVELVRCTTKNGGVLQLQYTMSNINISLSQITVKDCIFNDFYITADSSEVVPKKPKIREGNREFHQEISQIIFMAVFQSNIFKNFMIKLSKSTIVGYEYEYNISIVNGNDIRSLSLLNEYPNVVAWGAREKIGENFAKEYKAMTKNKSNKIKEIRIPPIKTAIASIQNNRIPLIKFKKLAIDKSDNGQASTINYHITKCDEQLISLEQWKGFIQDKLVMVAGKVLSRHGTSWLRPLAWIVSINFIAGIIFFHILNDSVCQYVIKECSFWYIFGEIFNPLSTPTGIAEGIKGDDYKPLKGPYIGLAISVLLSKAFYAMCIYEFVRAARRFTLK